MWIGTNPQRQLTAVPVAYLYNAWSGAETERRGLAPLAYRAASFLDRRQQSGSPGYESRRDQCDLPRSAYMWPVQATISASTGTGISTSTAIPRFDRVWVVRVAPKYSMRCLRVSSSSAP